MGGEEQKTSGAAPVPGRLIAIEGIDGTGKTTLGKALCEALRERGREAVFSFEPTRQGHGARLRELAAGGLDRLSVEDEIALFIADRAEHQQSLILPALAAGKDVVLDRYFYSSIAYQGARGGDPEEIGRRNRAIAREADAIILLRLPVEEALRRITHARGDAPDLFEGRERLERAAEIFDSLRHPKMLKLNAAQPAEKLVCEAMKYLDNVKPAAA